MVALDPNTGTLIQGDAGKQAKRILDNLLLALPDYGFVLDELCLARIYTTRMDSFTAINAAWESFFVHTPPPARTTVGVEALPLGAWVEIEFLFHRSIA
jgi:2-iminobutanoate/2-iminopropanoate deaminase